MTQEALPTLILFPHAGGNANAYVSLAGPLMGRARIHAVELPGHGRRMREPLLTSIQDMAENALAAVKDRLQLPYYLLGHSMGGLIAFAMTRAAMSEGFPLPVRLFVSGCAAPGKNRLKPEVSRLPSDLFWETVTAYGGLPHEFLAYPELKELFEPVLRTDFLAVAGYKPPRDPALPVPLTVLVGSEDTLSRDQILGWQEWTAFPIQLHTFPGGHFFLFDRFQEVAEIVAGQT